MILRGNILISSKLFFHIKGNLLIYLVNTRARATIFTFKWSFSLQYHELTLQQIQHNTKGSNEKVNSNISLWDHSCKHNTHKSAHDTGSRHIFTRPRASLMRKICPNITFNASVCHILGKTYNGYRKSIKEAMPLNYKFPDKNVQLSKSHVGNTLPAFPVSVSGTFSL